MLLFVGDDYYPGGPSEDFVGVFHSVNEAIERANQCDGDWWELLDTNGLLVESGRLERKPYSGPGFKVG